jgi:hypothetical protein
VKKARDSRLFKVTVPQAAEEIAVFKRTKKCFQRSTIFGGKRVYFAPL